MIGISLGLRQEVKLEQKLTLLPYESVGDLELLSLHRIKNRIKYLDIPEAVRNLLISQLINENKEYKERSKNDWNCITPSSLDNTVYNVDDYIEKQINVGVSTIDNSKIRIACKKVMDQEKETQTKKIKEWFYDNYDKIIYNMNGKIPYPIVKKMRDQLAIWSISSTNPFLESITDLIEKTAISEGLNPNHYESYEDIWDALKKI